MLAQRSSKIKSLDERYTWSKQSIGSRPSTCSVATDPSPGFPPEEKIWGWRSQHLIWGWRHPQIIFLGDGVLPSGRNPEFWSEIFDLVELVLFNHHPSPNWSD